MRAPVDRCTSNPSLHQVLDDLLYQRLVSAFLHGDDHKNSS